MSTIVDVREVFCTYRTGHGGVAALQGLTLQVEQGEICVILGPSGSGKTTLLRTIAGLERPGAGSAVVAGHDLSSLPPRALGRYRAEVLGYADQHYWRALAGELSAEELVRVPLGLTGVARAEQRRRARELLARVGLGGRAGSRPAQLSGGEQQRIALCAALARRPPLLVADEPTGELDRANAEVVYELLAELAREHGTTALVVSHDPRAATIADRVVHVRDGRVSSEDRGGRPTAVVDRGGWLQVPGELLAAAGIGGRATLALRDGAVELRPAPEAGEGRAAPAAVAPRSRAGATVEARSVRRSYGPQLALKGVTARFAPARLTAVTGPSGSGKSTLLALLAGLDVPDAGEILVDGLVVSAMPREARAGFRREHVAVVGQGPALFEFLGARENVELALALRGARREEAGRRALEALARVGLAAHAERAAGTLSGGERSRLSLARGLAAGARVLLVDEPTARLDTAGALELAQLLGDTARAGTTVVCATHDPVLVARADEVVDLGSSEDGGSMPSWPSAPTRSG